ncbi:DUF302 domain-containing protein [Alkalimarinus sediminis]|uniref:DUF302 domain-containing protein n=1 Tax=Alkalimarinus sediminis TaxID=1632866 RepID=A0A9E8HIG2_9ALTE|nr:DUF302 domain-containing protein [Alkalimarinus sediminis]UZW73306.1 DUF302 domain-containing protein [Alkalimarinus sediminis]
MTENTRPRILLHILFTLLFSGVLSGCSGRPINLPENYAASDALFDRVSGNVTRSESLKQVVEIDHSRLGQEVGSVMPPSRVLIFSNPAFESEVIQQNPLAAIDLPLRVLAYQSDTDGQAHVIYNQYDYLEARYGLEKGSTLEARFNKVMAEVLAGVPQERIAAFDPYEMSSDGIITLDSPFSFDMTVQRVQQAIDSQDDTVGFGRVDFRAQAKAIGVDINPSTLILFGAPAPGASAMSDAPTLGLDAFCQKMLIWQDDNNNVHLSFNDLIALADRQNVNKSLALRIINQRLKGVFEAALEE